MRWSEFVAACPEIAEVAEARFRADELVFLGTIRPDGTARVSPCEVDVAEGELLMGMMWRSHKALDLLRDPRITVHSATADRTNPGGDVKLRGRAVDVSRPDSPPGLPRRDPGSDRLGARRARVPPVLASTLGHGRLPPVRRRRGREDLGSDAGAARAPAALTTCRRYSATRVSGA